MILSLTTKSCDKLAYVFHIRLPAFVSVEVKHVFPNLEIDENLNLNMGLKKVWCK
jgi:hypothetical protein